MAQNISSSSGLVYLDTLGMIIYTSSIAAPLQFSIPTDTVSDMEVISEDKLKVYITSIFQQNANVLRAFTGVIVLSNNLIFEKPFIAPVTPQTQQEVDNFLDSVPFEQVATVIVEGQNSRVLAANKGYINAFTSAFEVNSAKIDLVLPAYFLDLDPNKILAFNPGILDSVLRRSSSLRQYNFSSVTPLKSAITNNFSPVEKKDANKSDEVDIKPNEEDNKKRLYLLIAVFAGLLIILGIVAVTML